jgi:hypothetical protein
MEHTETLLPNGTVLIAGGFITGALDPAHVEIYSPATGQFSRTGTSWLVHERHTATLLENGNVLLAAGSIGGGTTSSADLFTPASGGFTQTVDKASQTITFDELGDKTESDPDFTVTATASSELAVAFTATNQCSVSGTTVHLTGDGNCTITASQSGNMNYHPAADVVRSFTIAADTDGDGLPDATDPDDDNDGQMDVDEAACGSNPLDASSLSLDTDSDQSPNCVDADDDGDGVEDSDDAFPLDASRRRNRQQCGRR